ncbi:MAG: T9SS type A sorting domain-containing protein [Balneolaceae bacterium]
MRERGGIRVWSIIPGVLVWLLPGVLSAQSADINLTLLPESVAPQDMVTLRFSLPEATDVYYFGVEVGYDDTRLEFLGSDPGSLMSQGIHLSGQLVGSRIGASVSRTADPEADESGDLLDLYYRVKERAEPGDASFQIEDLELYNSEGDPVEYELSEPNPLEVDTVITDLIVPFSDSFEWVEGSSGPVTGRVYVNGVTDQEDEEVPDLLLWAGFYPEDTDPSGWSESAWSAMEFAGDNSEGFHLYSGEVGYGFPPGEYWIALRASFQGGDTLYGGVAVSEPGGFWDGVEVLSLPAEILPAPAYRHIVAEWTFDEEVLLPGRALFSNRFSEFSAVGVNLPAGFAAGASGRAASVSGWNDMGAESYWMIAVRTEQLQDLTLSSKQSGSNTGPRNFRVEGSLDGESWTPVPEGDITVGNDWTTGRLEVLELPSLYEDREVIYLRWLQTGEESVGDSSVEFGNQGTNRIDDVILRGEHKDPQQIGVWPGDANRDGEADQEDVLAIAAYWLAQGPVPLYPEEGWQEREAEQWIPEPATDTDTNGDGVVDHRDLRLVGRHFGQTRPGSKQAPPGIPLAQYSIHPELLKEGGEVAVTADSVGAVAGVAFRIRIRGAGREMIDRFEPGSWADESDTGASWIAFEHRPEERESVSGALALPGLPAKESGPELFTIRLHPLPDGEEPVEVLLEQLSWSDGDGLAVPVFNAEIYLRSEIPEPPEPGESPSELTLFQNYPNPVRSETWIGYQLPEEQRIRLELFDLSGRLVQTLVDGVIPAGVHEVSLEVSGLSSGVYLYRLVTPERVVAKKLLLLK